MSDTRWFHHNVSATQAEQMLVEKGNDGSFLVHPSMNSPGNYTLSVRWYHGSISGKEAEKLLTNAKSGSFLVRTSRSKVGDFVLSVKAEEKTYHITINYHDGKYDIGSGEQLDSLSDFIVYYQKNPMLSLTGCVIHLIQPLKITRVIVSDIKNRISELNEIEYGTMSEKSGFEEEFQQLQEQANSYSRPNDEGQKPENLAKNRYKNVLPIDDTRVVLRDCAPDEKGADYINANVVTDTKVEKIYDTYASYIVTQGCLQQTIPDFWHMVWQEKCRIIVTLTPISEKGQIKCAKYWPDEKDGPQEIKLYKGKLIIKALTEIILSDIILRKFHLYMEGQEEPTRKVYQYHFIQWPDYDVPRDPGILLDFMQLISNKWDTWVGKEQGSSPILVQCSDGIGRTGTYVVMDMILKEIKTQGLDCEIDIPGILQMVRTQRSGMVQTEAQYKFIYTVIMNYVETVQQHLAVGQKAETIHMKTRYTVQAAGGVDTETDSSKFREADQNKTIAKSKDPQKTPGQLDHIYENVPTYENIPIYQNIPYPKSPQQIPPCRPRSSQATSEKESETLYTTRL